MNEKTKSEIVNYLESNAFNLFVNLKGRWSCEKEYEDWNDYAEKMKETIPTHWKFVKATKRPFGMVAKVNGLKVHFHLKTKGRYVNMAAKVVK